MGRLDPVQLLNCLSILLSPNGGIKSKEVVQRLAKMMTQFSKKLVSKCIYIQILKCTETELLGLFMAVGGWRLVHLWLTESIVAKNWPLVRELLELLLLCPVDLERLKTNNCPKLVKELSKDGNHLAIRALASKLVEQWLKTVQGEVVVPILVTDIPKIVADAKSEIEDMIFKNEPVKLSSVDIISSGVNVDAESKTDLELEKSDPNLKDENDISNNVTNKEPDENEALPVLKITVKDGKQVLTQVEPSTKSEEKVKDKTVKSKSRDKSHEKSCSSSSKSGSSRHEKSYSSSSDKHRSKSSSSSNSKDRNSSSRDKSRDKERHSSTTRSENSKRTEKSSSSGRSKEERKSSSDKSKEKKDKDGVSVTKQLDEKTQSPSIHKLGKIPKLSDSKKEKPSISIEVRKPDEPKPKTVKTFNSKFRKHGLEEEVRPPPSRAALLSKKVPPVLPPTVPIPKRPSPVHNEAPPEKKLKTLETVEKPGAIKLIPAKPKRANWYLFHVKQSPNVVISLGFYVYCGKSRMYKLTGSKIFLSAVNFLYQINAELLNLILSILINLYIRCDTIGLEMSSPQGILVELRCVADGN